MQKLGVSTQLLAAAEIFQALERGVIDATEFSMPAMDIKLGFHQVAKFNYFPGWHQQVSVSEILMNKAAWDELSGPDKAMIEVAARPPGCATTTPRASQRSSPPWPRCQSKHGVKIKRWSDEDLAAFEKAWLEVLARRSRPRTRCSRRSPTTTRLPQEVRDLGRCADR